MSSKNVAVELQIKQTDTLDHENLAYAILDRQAEVNSAGVTQKEPKKRGRKSKAEKAAEPVTKANGDNGDADQTAASAAQKPAKTEPKKRGRKAKAEKMPHRPPTPRRTNPPMSITNPPTRPML